MKSALLSPLEFIDALRRGHMGKALKAIKAGQEMHPVIDRPKNEKASPLASLSWYDHAKAMKVFDALLEAGADPNQPTHGRLPLHEMIWLKDAPREAIVKMIEVGADPWLHSKTSPTREACNALDLCMHYSKPDRLEWLLSQNLPPQPTGCRTPILIVAAWHCSTSQDVEQYFLPLLRAGASPDAPDQFGRTARTEAKALALASLAAWEAECEASKLNGKTPIPTKVSRFTRL